MAEADEREMAQAWEQPLDVDQPGAAANVEPGQVMLSHHDPDHDDTRLEEIGAEAAERWRRLGGDGTPRLDREGQVIQIRP
jgi:hypothetical protein